MRCTFLWLAAVLVVLLVCISGCANSDSDEASTGKEEPDGESSTGPGQGGGDDLQDDDETDDDSDDDNDVADDDEVQDGGLVPFDDQYVASWPKDTIEPWEYDESPDPGPLRLKAMDYDQWHFNHHQPFYGSTLGVLYTDDSRQEVEFYFDSYDSCIWTATYLAAQAFRYYVTGEELAKQNALRMVQALSGHLHVTGKPGFLARFRGPQDLLVMPGDCDENPRCHLVSEGEYAGDFWWGDTSRDQYTGLFFGYAVAYDLVDDEAMRQTIRDDITEILDVLMDDHWMIIDVDGLPTGAFNVLPTMIVAWTLIGYHVTGEVRFKEELQKWIRNDRRNLIRLGNITWFNRYMDHYGNNLGHQNFYNLLRLARVYLGPDDFSFFLDVFDTQQHTFMRLAHNAFFNAIHMSQGRYVPGKEDDPFLAQLLVDLTDFRPAPNFQYSTTPPPAPLDPISVWLHDFVEAHPIFEPILGVNYQALEAYPVPYQCSTDFLWQRNPFAIHCGETEMLRKVQPGVDYLIAYWMSAYHQFLYKDQ